MQSSETELKKYIFYAILTFIFLILMFQFYRLQISQSSVYSEKSLQNSVKMVTRLPVRGNMYDRNGYLIVDNRPAFSIYIVPAETREETVDTVAALLNISKTTVQDELKKSGKYQPVKIVRQVDIKKLTWIQENMVELPGVEWKIEPKRHYVRSSGLAHLLGTLGEVDENELNDLSYLESGDMVGKKALERSFDRELRGKKGYKFVKVDAMGRVVEQIPAGKSALPEPGEHLYLSIDLRLQTFADTLMEGRRGALIAIDPRNGEILTLLSKPDYDIRLLSGVISSEIWDKLLNDPHHPLYDRVCQSGYPPGSTYKLVAAFAALNEEIIDPSWKVECPGYFRIGRKVVKCWMADGHGELDLEGAIKNSCNVYFYRLGLLIGLNTWNKYSRLFHFGEKTGVELTNENPGLVPSHQYYNKVYGEGKWTKGMLANLAVGQGELLTTPLQLAQFTTILANRGVLYRPHVGLKLVDPIDKQVRWLSVKGKPLGEIPLPIYDIILEGMREVVDGGTGWRAGIYGIPSAGKTGTAQNPHGDTHAWYIGFAPFDEPEIAICVLVENGGSGGGVSAPIASAYLKKYFYYQGKYDYAIEKILLARAAKKDSLAADSMAVVDSMLADTTAVRD